MFHAHLASLKRIFDLWVSEGALVNQTTVSVVGVVPIQQSKFHSWVVKGYIAW